MREFRRLEVWKRGHKHALAVRQSVSGFPRSGYTQLKSQITSAAESLPSNVVEGCGAFSNREFARFVEMSIKSSLELEYRLQLAYDLRVLGKVDWLERTRETIELRKMLCGLRKSLLDHPD